VHRMADPPVYNNFDHTGEDKYHSQDDDEPSPKRRKKDPNNAWNDEDDSFHKSTENKRAKERERRRHISGSIDDLRRCIPPRFHKERLNQVATMAMAVEYIRHLQQHAAELEAALERQSRGFEGGYSNFPSAGFGNQSSGFPNYPGYRGSGPGDIKRENSEPKRDQEFWGEPRAQKNESQSQDSTQEKPESQDSSQPAPKPESSENSEQPTALESRHSLVEMPNEFFDPGAPPTPSSHFGQSRFNWTGHIEPPHQSFYYQNQNGPRVSQNPSLQTTLTPQHMDFESFQMRPPSGQGHSEKGQPPPPESVSNSLVPPFQPRGAGPFPDFPGDSLLTSLSLRRGRDHQTPKLNTPVVNPPEEAEALPGVFENSS